MSIIKTAKPAKTYRIQTEKIVGRGTNQRPPSVAEGTLEELIKYFSYTLEIGNSWNKKINRYPKTIKSFVTNLQNSYEEKESACYDRTSVTLLP